MLSSSRCELVVSHFSKTWIVVIVLGFVTILALISCAVRQHFINKKEKEHEELIAKSRYVNIWMKAEIPREPDLDTIPEIQRENTNRVLAD